MTRRRLAPWGALAASAFAALAAPVSAAVVNFDGYQPRYDFTQPVIVSDGFRFAVTCLCIGVEDRQPTDVFDQPLPGAYNGTASLIYSTDPLRVTAEDGAAFFLNRVDLGQSWYVPDADVGSTAILTYELAGGGQGQVDVVLDRSYHTVDVRQQVLGFTISGGRTFGYVTLDNLVVNEMPEPASTLLAGLALAGVALSRRRARA